MGRVDASTQRSGPNLFAHGSRSSSSRADKKDHAERELQHDEQAYELTHASSQQHLIASPLAAHRISRLDPKSDDFQPFDWARSFYDLRYNNGKEAIPRVAGLAFRGLNVWGMGFPTDFQATVGNTILKLPALFGRGLRKISILQDLDGLLLPGEQLCVLGPPGSGCSTLLKTIAAETHGFHVSPDSHLNYGGVPASAMSSIFRGEAIYTAELDAHYPELSVGDTLYFAALARAPRRIPGGATREQYAEHLRDVVMAMFGISHTINTRVGNDFVRGVSGGERKRVTIAEAALSFAPLQCWDNSTRGLDSANAVEFCRSLRIQCNVFKASTCVAIYQAPQAAYEMFDKVTLLYEGRQIYFGPCGEARSYFERLGFDCPASQTTPDFLTSMTSASERQVRAGFENTVPRSSEDFARCWKNSPERRQLCADIQAYDKAHALEGAGYEQFALSRTLEKSAKQSQHSPYNLSYWGQVRLCVWRDVRRLKNDPTVTIAMLIINIIEAMIIASLFSNLPKTTASFFRRGGLLFMIILLNAFSSVIEIMTLYAKRTTVEKHMRYAFYHPSAEALSAMIVDLPYKIVNSLIVNTILYFVAHLRRDAGSFFFFLLIGFTVGLSMSMFFRLFGSMTKTIAQALAPSALFLITLVLYTGFVIPVQYMRAWASWIRWVNPVSYGLESLLTNEFHGREFNCSTFIPSGPGYEGISKDQRACAVKGAVPGSDTVDGSAFVMTSFHYRYSNRWSNYIIILGITVFLCLLHLVMSEIVTSERSTGEVLVFRRSKLKKKPKHGSTDEENGNQQATAHPHQTLGSVSDQEPMMEKQVSIFHWEKVNYEVQIKNEKRTILQSVDGWIKPGTLTALMGVSGAGKTTLLDVLASRATTGVISGSMLVDGRERDESFQRKTGYAMQQDIHLATSTVREALEFSALLRQPPNFSREQKLAYVDHVIQLLDMEQYADAIVGIPGSGLNVEQRKRLTIGVELAARPKLLLFLDEPTSGLDSQTSWSICDLMEKLTRNGQAILCTVHQPSSLLFQRFDRILLLAKGGQTVYFGDIGRGSETLLDYFERNGAPKCPPGANPAEYMLEAIGAAPGVQTEIDWPAVWKSSEEYAEVQTELARLRNLARKPSPVMGDSDAAHQEFAASFKTQLVAVSLRCAQQYWRTPSYIYSKLLLTVGSALMIGCSFIGSKNTMQGLQNQMFGVFVFLFVVIQLIYQILPMWITQRTLYEARERQSKTYAWQVFVISNLAIEMGWNALMAILCFLFWYFPAGLYHNAEATGTAPIRGLHTVLIVIAIFLFTSTFSHMLVAGAPNEDVAAAIATLMSIVLYAFSGILIRLDDLPRSWIFMYRINPFNYIASSFLSATLGQAPAFCADNEFQRFLPPAGQTCAQFMHPYITRLGGYLRDPPRQQALTTTTTTTTITHLCHYCQMDTTNQFLQRVNVQWSHRWRDFGLVWVYIAFNVAAAIFLYWLCRVPKKRKRRNIIR